MLDILPIGMRPRYIHNALNVHILSFRGSGTVHTSHEGGIITTLSQYIHVQDPSAASHAHILDGAPFLHHVLTRAQLQALRIAVSLSAHTNPGTPSYNAH